MPYNLPYPANPLNVRQAPDFKALDRSTQLVVPGANLSTPPIAQEYFQPGINTSLKRRKTPKTNYELPSDLPSYPFGFVPTNQTPGARGEEPPLVVQRELVPGNLLDMFAKISAQQALESQAVEEAKVMGRQDAGTLIAQEYQTALKEKVVEAKVEALVADGFTQTEAVEAVNAVRMEKAIEMAKKPIRPQMVSIESALSETFPSSAAASSSKPSYEEIASFKAREQREKDLEDVRKIREREAKMSEEAEGKRLAQGGTPQEREFTERVKSMMMARKAGEKPPHLTSKEIMMGMK